MPIIFPNKIPDIDSYAKDTALLAMKGIIDEQAEKLDEVKYESSK